MVPKGGTFTNSKHPDEKLGTGTPSGYATGRLSGGGAGVLCTFRDTANLQEGQLVVNPS